MSCKSSQDEKIRAFQITSSGVKKYVFGNPLEGSKFRVLIPRDLVGVEISLGHLHYLDSLRLILENPKDITPTGDPHWFISESQNVMWGRNINLQFLIDKINNDSSLEKEIKTIRHELADEMEIGPSTDRIRIIGWDILSQLESGKKFLVPILVDNAIIATSQDGKVVGFPLIRYFETYDKDYYLVRNTDFIRYPILERLKDVGLIILDFDGSGTRMINIIRKDVLNLFIGLSN